MFRRILPSLALCAVFSLLPSENRAEAKEQQGYRENSAAHQSIVVTILGSGTPVPSRTQAGAAILVEAAGELFMFDCGRGCTTRLAQVDPELIGKVSRLFITHMHSDHVVGIPDLWLNGWVLGRQTPMTIWGPEGTPDMMGHIRQAFSKDIAFRQADGVPASSDGLEPDFHTLAPEGGIVYQDGGVVVTAFRVDHSIVSPAYGYRIDYNGRSVMISGDTTVSENLYKYGAGADIVLLEVMSPALIKFMNENYSPQQAQKVLRYHLTAEQAAKIFAETAPQLGVYYHTRNEPGFAAELMAKTQEIYGGPLVIGHDLMQIRLGDGRPTVIDLRLTKQP